MTETAAVPLPGGRISASSVVTRAAKGGKVDQWICLWSYPVAMNAVGFAMIYLAPFIPTMSPNSSAAEIAALYRDNLTGIQWAICILLLAMGVGMLFQGLVVAMMRHMSGPGPLLSYLYLAALAGSLLPAGNFFVLCWGVAAFRPDRAPELIMMMNDVGYLCFIAIISGFLTQYISLAVSIFFDSKRVLPLWLGYVNVWLAVSELLLVPTFIFKTGPFAWGGILTFWLALILFGVWIVAMIVGVYTAVRSDALASVRVP